MNIFKKMKTNQVKSNENMDMEIITRADLGNDTPDAFPSRTAWALAF